MKKVSILFILLALAALGAVSYWTFGNMAPNPSDHSNKIFVINKGDSVRAIGNNLKTQGLIRDAVAFFIYIKLNGQEKNIQAGDYRLSPSMNLRSLVNDLNHGTLDIWVTVPEGLRAEEIADIFKKDLPSYKDSWRKQLDANEGYLFPDTYLVPREADGDAVVTMMRNNFDTRMKQTNISEVGTKFTNAVIIASIIEKEAKFSEDFPIVSSVIHNRLADGMALQVDPSVAYALGYQKDTGKWWKQELTFDDLKVNSLYNTYKNPGLPPTPISNPGITAIQAALNPASTNYLYYISDKSGKIHPARTIQEHNANIAKYL